MNTYTRKPEIASEDQLKTLTNELIDLPYSLRLVWFLSLLMILSSASIMYRPENGISNFMLEEYGVQPEAVAFSLLLSGLVIPLVFLMTNNFNYVGIASIPGIVWFVAFSKQVADSDSAPIIPVTITGGLIVAIILLIHFARKLDCLERENQELYNTHVLIQADKDRDK